ncbi:NAD(P)/FAD-dependent oxidoreductase [Belliella pelovolcani]|uniref:NAD(P)/FAD-dependent oxidoreductase n=1 Tax=Belliella pelovolcani TaxID=529505 RepID=UPI00391C7DB8
MLSYWEKTHFLKYDLIVIGAGIVGMSTAIQYKLKFPQSSIAILERGVFPSGASTKNAGFACFGSLTEILDDLNMMSEEEVLALVEKRYQGLHAIRKVFGDETLGYQDKGGFELITSQEVSALDQMNRINKLLMPLFGKDVFSVEKNIHHYGFGKEVLHIVRNKFEGELDIGKYILALWEKCQQLGIRLHTGAEVIRIDGQQIHVKEPLTNDVIQFEALKIAICTNAFAKRFFPELDISPGRGLVMVSTPMQNKIPWEGAFHYDKGYVYFRKVAGNRLLIGGGRNLDFEGERTETFEVNPLLRTNLEKLTRAIVFPDHKVEFEMEWTGIMAFGESKKPIIQRVSANIGVGVRLGGMGVAIGWQAGTELVGLL